MVEPAPTSRAAELLRRAFSIVREDVPEAHTMMVARAPGTILLQIDEDRLALTRTTDTIEISLAEGGATGDVHVRSTSDALLGVLDGKATLLEALLDGSVFVAGDVGALAEAQEALFAFLQGCVRAPRTLHLLDRFRADHEARTSKTPTGREAA